MSSSNDSIANSTDVLPALRASGINKSFGPIAVLHDIDFEVYPGEIHALLGENGAGKSTLVKILAGFEQPTSGSLAFNGAPTAWGSMRDAEENGIVLIHQELNLAGLLSVEENIFLGREIKKGLFVDHTAMRKKSRTLLDQLECRASVTARVDDLSVADQQMIEIAKATSRNANVLFLDEPTAVLTPHETKSLFKLLRRLKSEGVAIVFISHKLDEIEQIADRITVLRDGKHIDTVPAHSVTKDDMARLMVGRDLTEYFPHIPVPDKNADIVLSVQGVATDTGVVDAGFDLRRAEVLGFAGLQGAGRTALMEALIGLDPVITGTVRQNGTTVKFKTLGDAKAARIAYLTKDRKGKGLLLGNDLVHNFSLFALEKFTRFFINRKAERTAFDAAAKQFDLRAASPKMLAGSLSGGNQQKLLLAKVLEINPDIIILDEPTRGIDVGAKSQIYGFIADLVSQGRSVIVLSSELSEIIGLSSRVVVMHEGRITGVLEGDQITEEEIMRYATGLGASNGAGKNNRTTANTVEEIS